MERFNRSYKAVWIREDPFGEGFTSILSYKNLKSSPFNAY